MTWSKRQVTVSGPTPPILGVMAVRSARALTSSEMSPLMTPFSLAVPASIIVVPGLIMSALIKSGIPVAVIITSYSANFVKSSPRWKRVTS